MTEKKQLSTCDTLYVVGHNDRGQLGLGHRIDVKEITKWTASNVAITKQMSVHNGRKFAIISSGILSLDPLTFGFIRETCDSVPEPIMQVCVQYGADDLDRSSAF